MNFNFLYYRKISIWLLRMQEMNDHRTAELFVVGVSFLATQHLKMTRVWLNFGRKKNSGSPTQASMGLCSRWPFFAKGVLRALLFALLTRPLQPDKHAHIDSRAPSQIDCPRNFTTSIVQRAGSSCITKSWNHLFWKQCQLELNSLSSQIIWQMLMLTKLLKLPPQPPHTNSTQRPSSGSYPQRGMLALHHPVRRGSEQMSPSPSPSPEHHQLKTEHAE